MERVRHATPSVGSDERGQSVYDFAIGASVFLVVVIAVLTFVPTAIGTVDGETAASPTDKVVAERVADQLVREALSPSGASNALSPTCLIGFFSDRDECGFGSDDVATDLGLARPIRGGTGGGQPLNVTIRGDITGDGDERLCYDLGADRVRERDEVNCAAPDVVMLTSGATTRGNTEFVSARRFTTLDVATVTVSRDVNVQVTVRTW